MTTILDPTDERQPVHRDITPRPQNLSGTVALLDISKPRGSLLLDRLQQRFNERLPQVKTVRYSKPTFTKPAPDPLRQEILASSDFVVEALAD